VTEWTESTETYEAKRSAQAQLDAEDQQGERLAVVLTRKAFAAASPHLDVVASVEPADRDRVWRRTDGVALGAA